MKLGTVFSGIGAIEHALDRMNIEHEIVFACDNGDIEIDSPAVINDLDSIKSELKRTQSEVRKTTERLSKSSYSNYCSQVETMISGAEKQYEDLLTSLHVNEDSHQIINKAINASKAEVSAAIDRCTPSKKKKYQELKKIIESQSRSFESKLFVLLRFNLALSKDQIIPDSKEIKEAFNLKKEDAKRIVKKGKDLTERLQMVNSKLLYLTTRLELEKLDSFQERKKYVNSLYEGKEKQNKVRQSYLANYDINEDDFHWNIAFMDGKQYENKVDLFVGGSPCQSFSLVGKQRGLEDTRGTLFYEYARLIKEIKPKVFIYENVKAILSNDNGKTWETMKDVFLSLGYKVYYTLNGKPSVLNAKDYGIPQNRERMFVVGFREDLQMKREFTFPSPVPLETKMQDYLLDNVSGAYYLPKKGVDFVTKEKNLQKRYTQIDGEVALCQKKNQQFNWHGDFVFVEENKDMEKTMEDLEKYFLSEKVEKYVLSTGTKNFYSKPKTDLEVARPLLTSMHKMHRAGVDNYVHTNGRLRKLTPRECLRLMGFCDSFKIVVSDTSMYQQAGNSIVVDVLIAIMNKILESVNFED